MTDYKRGDIVLVPFPFSDQAATKKRPAVVISSSRYNIISKDIVIMRQFNIEVQHRGQRAHKTLTALH